MAPRLHHLALTAADLAETAPFYDAVLEIVGYKQTHASERLCVWGEQHPEVLLYPVEGDDRSPHRKGRPGLQHLAIEVDDKQTIGRIHDAVVAGGWTVVFAPKEYPDYAEGYYAVFVEDPDGNRWEFLYAPTPI